MNNSVVITNPEQVTPEWLTAVLRKNGVLSDGRVQTITRKPLDSQNSNMTRLMLTYAGTAVSDLPTSLMLKIVVTEPGEFGDSEVAYYTKDYVNLSDAPLLPCYHAAYAAEQHAYHLLLKDVSETHVVNWERTPTLAYGRALAKALATLHTHWWDDDALPKADDQITIYLTEVLPGLEPLLALTKGDIPPEWAAVLPKIVEHLPELLHGRCQQHNHLTLIHGDANPGNILSPVVGERPLYLIDRQPFDWSITVWLGVNDLAYQLGLWWDTAVRHQLEMEVLQHYHTCLIKQGISHYSWGQLLADYKLCLLQQICVPLAWCTEPEAREKMKWAWLPQLQKVMTAVTDLECMNIL